MIYSSTISGECGTDYGICISSTIMEATQMVIDACGLSGTDYRLDVQPGAESVLAEQYDGLAFLTTERGTL